MCVCGWKVLHVWKKEAVFGSVSLSWNLEQYEQYILSSFLRVNQGLPTRHASMKRRGFFELELVEVPADGHDTVDAWSVRFTDDVGLVVALSTTLWPVGSPDFFLKYRNII